MASPQLEDGFTRIANEILEHLIVTHLSSNQWQVLLCIIRKTYGFTKKADYIANSQIVDATGLCKAVVSRSLKTLTLMNVIEHKGKFVGLQKDWEKWHKLAILSTLDEKLAIQSTVEKLAIQSTKLAISSTKVSSPRITQKKKETYTKEIVLPDWINKELWNAFKEMRKKLKKPVTDKGEELLLKRLIELRETGNEANKVLERTIENSWTGFFPLSESGNGHSKQQAPASKYTYVNETEGVDDDN